MGLPEQPKRGLENIKSELNRVAVPRFGPILRESVAMASPMAVVALEPPKTKKSAKNMKIHDFGGSPPAPCLHLYVPKRVTGSMFMESLRYRAWALVVPKGR